MGTDILTSVPYVLDESMHFPPPSPIKPQHLASLDVFSCRVVSRTKKSTEARLEEYGSCSIPGAEEKMDKESNRRSGGGRRQRPTGCMDVLTNLLGCRGSETVSSVLVPVPRLHGGRAHKRRGGSGSQPGQDGYVKGGDHSNFRKNRVNDRGEKKVSSTTAKYKPVGVPNCSQCGRRFNPEKLHSHMKSCKALKARTKGRDSFVEATATKFRTESNRTSEPSSQEFSRESTTGLLL